jgi:uncharacterized protein Yka (UPF0111/DUF47 family)
VSVFFVPARLEGASRRQARLRRLPLRSATALYREVDEREAQADHVMRAAMARLFHDETDARELAKLEAVHELLETLTDSCEDAAHRVESRVMRYGG